VTSLPYHGATMTSTVDCADYDAAVERIWADWRADRARLLGYADLAIADRYRDAALAALRASYSDPDGRLPEGW